MNTEPRFQRTLQETIEYFMVESGSELQNSLAGAFQDEPLWDDFVASMREYRDRMNNAPDDEE